MKFKHWCMLALLMGGSGLWGAESNEASLTVEQQLAELRRIVLEQQKKIEALELETKKLREGFVSESEKVVASQPTEKAPITGEVADEQVVLPKEPTKAVASADKINRLTPEISEVQETSTKEMDYRNAAKGIDVDLGDGYGSLKVAGELRFRWENVDTETFDRDRLRTRFRLGSVWQSEQKDWEIGFGITTSTDDKYANSTWGSGSGEDFGHMKLRLDYAYARHYWENSLGEHAFTIGQERVPYIYGSMLWDGDMAFVGFTYDWSNSGYFLKTGLYELYDLGADHIEDKTWMFAAQGGYRFEGETLDGLFLLGAYVINDRNDEETVGLEFPHDNFQFQILQIYGEVSTMLNDVKVTGYSDVWYNLGAKGTVSGNGFDPDTSVDGENALGFVAGIKGTRGAFTMGIEYIYCGAFATYWNCADDFGLGISYPNKNGNMRDVHGFGLYGTYNFNDNIYVSAFYTYYHRLHNRDVEDERGHTLRVNLGYRF